MKAALARAIGRIALRLGTRRTPASRPGTADAAEFEIFTFVTDDAQYDDMRRSFEAAGFTRFARLSDRDTEPYAFIAGIGTRDAHAILVHQDVRAERDAGELRARLAELDPGWTVAGTAGCTPALRLVRRLDDPYGGSTDDDLPAYVRTLDEHFLVFNRRHAPRCTPGLHGFHLYGADVALNGRAYVVDYPVVHLSGGTKDAAFDEAKRRFVDAWSARRTFDYVRGPSLGIVFLSRFAALRHVFGSAKVLSWVQDVSLEAQPEADVRG